MPAMVQRDRDPPDFDEEARAVCLTLAAFLLLGYASSRLFWTFRLPPVLGLVVVGVVHSQLARVIPQLESFTEDFESISPLLCDLIFFIVLVRVGLAINFKDLAVLPMLFGTLPFLCDAGAVAAVALAFGITETTLEALCLGMIGACLGDGLVVTRLVELRVKYPQHASLPQMLNTSAPIEATVALTSFGILISLAGPKGHYLWAELLGVVALRLASTCLLCWAVAFAICWALDLGRDAKPRYIVLKRPLFTGHELEDMLILVGVSFSMYSLGCIVPNGINRSNLLQPELCAILSAACMANHMSRARRAAVERILASVWVVMSIVFFTTLGTKLKLEVMFSVKGLRMMAMLLAGICARGCGALLLLVSSRASRRCCSQRCEACLADNTSNLWREALIVAFAGMPRAAVQGALGHAAVVFRAFDTKADDPKAHHFAQLRQEQMEDFAVITIACCAPLGTLLLTKVGSRLMSKSERTCTQCLASQSSREELNRSSASVISSAEARDGALAASAIHSTNGNTFNAITPTSNQLNHSSSTFNCSSSNHNHHNHHSNGTSWRRAGTSSALQLTHVASTTCSSMHMRGASFLEELAGVRPMTLDDINDSEIAPRTVDRHTVMTRLRSGGGSQTLLNSHRDRSDRTVTASAGSHVHLQFDATPGSSA